MSFGAVLVIKHHITVGALAACTLLSGKALQPLAASINIVHNFKVILNSEYDLNKTSRLFEVSAVDIVKPTSTTQVPNLSEAFDFQVEDLSFHYPPDDKCTHLLENINLTMKQGEIIALTGDDEAGKRTLLKLFAGQLEPVQGNIIFLGKYLNQYSNTELFSKVSYISQKIEIFSGSILENITMFREELNQKACELVKSLGFQTEIDRLSKGFHTMIGVNVKEHLPTGLNRLISIARGFLFNPKLVLLDKVSVGLDVKSNICLQKYIETYKQQAMIIMITHRPAWLDMADRVYQIKNHHLIKINKH